MTPKRTCVRSSATRMSSQPRVSPLRTGVGMPYAASHLIAIDSSSFDGVTTSHRVAGPRSNRSTGSRIAACFRLTRPVTSSSTNSRTPPLRRRRASPSTPTRGRWRACRPSPSHRCCVFATYRRRVAASRCGGSTRCRWTLDRRWNGDSRSRASTRIRRTSGSTTSPTAPRQHPSAARRRARHEHDGPRSLAVPGARDESVS